MTAVLPRGRRPLVRGEHLWEALEAVKDAPNRDDALIELFELHNGSQYVERFFYHDANPSVYCDIEEVDPDA